MALRWWTMRKANRRGDTLSILFVSGTETGGAARSTHELAMALRQRGHHTETLMRRRGSARRDYLYKRAVNLATKLDGNAAARGVSLAAAAIGRATTLSESHGYPVRTCVHVENAVPTLLRRLRPDVVVASSLERVAWRRLRETARGAGIPSVLYLREASALGHLSISEAPPDLLLTNARSHGDGAQLLGHEAVFIPSLVDVSRAKTQTTRRTVLLINPLPSHGVETALAMAEARPDVPFVLQESWAWADHGNLVARVQCLPNVELRPHQPTPALVYADARILLVPHQMDNRPRVILEAQSNGIPVIGSDWPGIADAVGPGGVLLPSAAPLADWLGALDYLWTNDESYSTLSGAAIAHAGRDEVQPDHILSTFEHVVYNLIQERDESRSDR